MIIYLVRHHDQIDCEWSEVRILGAFRKYEDALIMAEKTVADTKKKWSMLGEGYWAGTMGSHIEVEEIELI